MLLVLHYYWQSSYGIFNKMEKFVFNYSTKNVLIREKTPHYIKMIEKLESLIRRIRCKAHLFLNMKEPHKDKKETFGFKTSQYPLQIPELERFEKGLCNLVNLIKFRTNMNSFQIQLTHDIRKIRKSTSLLVFADKTSNIYEMPLEEYNQLLK